MDTPDPVQLALASAVVLWAVVSMVSRFWGGLVGAAGGAALGAWGWWVMGHGGKLYALGLPRSLQPGAFYSVCSLLVFINVAAAIRATRQPR